jgi:YegS/Rv2252/BmrU family lipid kinase
MADKMTSPAPIRAILIFNPTAGRPEESPEQLSEIINEMQNHAILPEVYLVRPDSQVDSVVRNAIKSGIELVVVAGGDGTIESSAGAILGSQATLGIIPTGTRNNVAFNLGIPMGIPEAVALLRDGRRIKIDLGYLQIGQTNRWFLEASALGIVSDLYPSADNIQHGDLGQIGTFLSTFVSSTPSQLRVILDEQDEFEATAYMVIVTNMPYIGPRFQAAPDIAYDDSLLDVFIFSDMSKLDLITYAMQATGGPTEDTRVKHSQVRRVTIHSDPPMPILADGVTLEPGSVDIMVHPRALQVIAAPAVPVEKSESEPSQSGATLNVVPANG